MLFVLKIVQQQNGRVEDKRANVDNEEVDILTVKGGTGAVIENHGPGVHNNISCKGKHVYILYIGTTRMNVSFFLCSLWTLKLPTETFSMKIIPIHR